MTDYDDDFDSALDALDEPVVGGRIDRETFRIRDSEQAEWALRKLRAAKDEVAAINDAATARINAIAERATIMAKGPADNAEFFESKLTEYHRHLLQMDPKKISVKLFGGTLKSHAGFTVLDTGPDEAAVLAWCRENAPHLVRQPAPPEPSLDKVAMKKLANERGQIDVTHDGTYIVVPGVHLVRNQRSFTVDTTTEKDEK